MVIITGNKISKLFNKIPEYNKDLGMATYIDDSGKRGGSKDYKSGGDWKIKDNVMKVYYEYNRIYPSRCGKIGSLLFYIDYSLFDNRVYVIDDDQNIFLFHYNEIEIRDYISSILKQVLNGEVKAITEIEEVEEVVVDLKNMTNEELVEYFTKKKD